MRSRPNACWASRFTPGGFTTAPRPAATRSEWLRSTTRRGARRANSSRSSRSRWRRDFCPPHPTIANANGATTSVSVARTRSGAPESNRKRGLTGFTGCARCANAVADTIISDQAVRDRIRDDLGVTLVIEAAAGTGKTTALVNRIVSVIGSGRGELARIVAVTFTEKAAGELKLRLRGEIERARHNTELLSDARARFDEALKQLEEARIGTIHSFCADLLRERPVEARVDPMFEVAPEDVAGEMFDAAFERWFERVLDNPGEGMRRLLRRRDLSERTGPRAIARRAALELLNWRDFDSPWQHSPLECGAEIDAIVAEVEALGKLSELGEPDDWLARGLDAIARPVAEATRLEAVRGRDYDALESVLIALCKGRHWNWKGYGGDFGEAKCEEVFQRRAELHARLKKFRDDAGANLAPLLRDELWPIVAI